MAFRKEEVLPWNKGKGREMGNMSFMSLPILTVSQLHAKSFDVCES